MLNVSWIDTAYEISDCLNLLQIVPVGSYLWFIFIIPLTLLLWNYFHKNSNFVIYSTNTVKPYVDFGDISIHIILLKIKIGNTYV